MKKLPQIDLQKQISTPNKNLSQIQDEINEKIVEVNEKEEYFNSLKIVSEVIQEASDKRPLFLDGVLIQYDDERMDAALKFISDYANQKGKEFQLILFTCHQHIIEKAKHYANSIVEI